MSSINTASWVLWPIRGQCSDHVIWLDQSVSSIRLMTPSEWESHMGESPRVSVVSSPSHVLASASGPIRGQGSGHVIYSNQWERRSCLLSTRVRMSFTAGLHGLSYINWRLLDDFSKKTKDLRLSRRLVVVYIFNNWWGHYNKTQRTSLSLHWF